MRVKSLRILLGLRCCCTHSDFNRVNLVQWDSFSQGFPIVRISIMMFGVVWKFEIWVYVAKGIQVMSLCAIFSCWKMMMSCWCQGSALTAILVWSLARNQFVRTNIFRVFEIAQYLGVWDLRLYGQGINGNWHQYVELLISSEGTGLGNILLWFGELESNPCRFGQGLSIHFNMRSSLFIILLVLWWCCAHSDFI